MTASRRSRQRRDKRQPWPECERQCEHTASSFPSRTRANESVCFQPVEIAGVVKG